MAFAAGIAATLEAGFASAIAVAAIAGGLFGGMAPPAPRGGFGRTGQVATSVLLSLLACALGAGLAARERAGDPGKALLAEWRRSGFEPQRSPARLAGTIEELERLDGDRAAIVVQADRAAFSAGESWSRVSPACRIRLTVPWPERDSLPWRAGDRFETTARMAPPRSYGNPGAFDYRLYLAARGISLAGQVKSARLFESRPPEGAAIATLPARLRARLVDHLEAAAGPERHATAAFLAALLFGERQALDPGFETTLQRAGVYHVLALSGFNVACVLMAAGAILGCLPVAPRSRRLLLLLMAVAYVLLARSSGSILRAGLMVVLHGSGRIAARRTSALGALLVSALVLLAFRPLWLADAGFQLSYLATGALLMTGAPPRGRREIAPGDPSPGRRLAGPALGGIRALSGMILAGFAAFVATAPLTARQFQTVTPAGIVANLVVVPSAALALLLGGAAIATLGVFPQVAAWCFPPAGWLLRGIAATSERASAWPLGNLFVVPPGWGLTLATLAALAGSRLLARPSARRVSASAALLLGGAILGAGRWDPAATGRLDLIVWDVGQGDSILVRTPGGATVLIDTGGLGRGDFDVGSKVVAPALRSLGILHLDVLAITHAHRDHVGGATSILAQFRPRAVWLGALPPDDAVTRRLEAAAFAAGSVVVRPRAGVTISLAGARFEVLHPGRDAPPRDRANDQSLVLRVSAGSEAALLTGDIEADVEQALLDGGRSRSAALLKVAHHGSRTSTGNAFLDAVAPRAALISVGAANPWGHPSETVIDRLRRAGVAIYRTDIDGAIGASTDGRHPFRIAPLLAAPPSGRQGVELERRSDEGQDEDDHRHDREQPPARPQRGGVVEGWRVTDAEQGEDEREQDQVIAAGAGADRAHHHQEQARQPLVPSGRDRVQDVPAVQLRQRNQVERGDEQSEPAGDERRVQVNRRRLRREEAREEEVEQEARRKRQALRRQRPSRGRVPQAIQQDRQRHHEAGDGPGDADVEEGAARREGGADADDRPEGAEGVRRGQKEGEGRVDPIDPAGDVMPHLVRPEDQNRPDRVGQAVAPGARPAPEVARPGDQPGGIPGHENPGGEGPDEGQKECTRVDPRGEAAARRRLEAGHGVGGKSVQATSGYGGSCRA